jgi:hypothetical protein
MEKKMKGMNMLQHPGTIFKTHKWYLSNSFRDELIQEGFPKMGITDEKQIQSVLRELSYGVRKLGEENADTTTVNNVILDMGELKKKTQPKSIFKRENSNQFESSSEDTLSLYSEDDRE